MGNRTVPQLTTVAAKKVAAMVGGRGVGMTWAFPPPHPSGKTQRRLRLPPPKPSASTPGIDTGIDDQAEGDRGVAANAPTHPAAADASAIFQGHSRDERDGADPVSVTCARGLRLIPLLRRLCRTSRGPSSPVAIGDSWLAPPPSQNLFIADGWVGGGEGGMGWGGERGTAKELPWQYTARWSVGRCMSA